MNQPPDDNNPNRYTCGLCNYSCSKKSHMTQHCETEKHKIKHYSSLLCDAKSKSKMFFSSFLENLKGLIAFAIGCDIMATNTY